MSTIVESERAFHRGTAAVFALLTSDQMRKLAELQADATLAVRVAELAAKANEGELSDAERAEYEGYIDANNVVAVLQSEARYRLGSNGS